MRPDIGELRTMGSGGGGCGEHGAGGGDGDQGATSLDVIGLKRDSTSHRAKSPGVDGGSHVWQ
jgi:hypothetical protein